MWRLLDLEFEDPFRNVAAEEALLIAVDREGASNTLRFWRNSNAVVIGRSPKTLSEVDVNACRRHQTSIVRRITGGGAVYQDHGNLNWTFVARRSSPLASIKSGIQEIFDTFGKPIIRGLKNLGADAEFLPPNSIQIGDKKISGMATYVKQRSVLCHGTLLVSTDSQVLKSVLKILKAEVTTLRDELGENVSIESVKKALMTAFSEEYSIETRKGRLSETERGILERLYKDKYTREEWNFEGKTT